MSAPVRTLTVNVSNVAAILGLNPYKSRSDAVANVLNPPASNRADYTSPADARAFQNSESALLISHAINRAHSSDPAIVERELKAIDPTFSAEQHAAATLPPPPAILQDTASPPLHPLARLIEHTKKTAGIMQEPNILAQFGAQSKMRPYPVKWMSTTLLDDGKIRILLNGRADGIVYRNNNKIVVEVKKRINEFFLPQYEIVQCQLYMYMYVTDKCIHVQALGGQLQINEIERDDRLIKQYIDGTVAALLYP